MSERIHAAKIMLAVQAALKAGDQPQNPIVAPGSVDILNQLRAAGTHGLLIGDVAEGRADLTPYAVYRTLKTLEDSGLVSMDEDAGTIQLTSSGKAAVGD